MLDELVSSLHGAMNDHQDINERNLNNEESGTTCIDAPFDRPLYHPIYDLERRSVLELRPILEAWINHDKREKPIHLIGNNAYGLRIYQNQSRLNMHVDQSRKVRVSIVLSCEFKCAI